MSDVSQESLNVSDVCQCFLPASNLLRVRTLEAHSTVGKTEAYPPEPRISMGFSVQNNIRKRSESTDSSLYFLAWPSFYLRLECLGKVGTIARLICEIALFGFYTVTLLYFCQKYFS